jgi:hypothetical protein
MGEVKNAILDTQNNMLAHLILQDRLPNGQPNLLFAFRPAILNPGLYFIDNVVFKRSPSLVFDFLMLSDGFRRTISLSPVNSFSAKNSQKFRSSKRLLLTISSIRHFIDVNFNALIQSISSYSFSNLIFSPVIVPLSATKTNFRGPKLSFIFWAVSQTILESEAFPG